MGKIQNMTCHKNPSCSN